MINRIARLSTAHNGRILLGALVLLPLLAALGGGVKDRLSVGGFVDPAAESTRAAEYLEARFGTAPPNYVLVASAVTGDVLEPANREAGVALVQALRDSEGVIDVVSAWTLGDLPQDTRNPLRSKKGDRAVIAMRLAGDEDEQRKTADALANLADPSGRLTLLPTATAAVSRAAADQAERDLVRAELIAAPLTLVGLLVVFKGWRAAAIPLTVAVLAVLGTFTLLSLLAKLTTISVFALNLTTALGLGLAVDYSLLIVARFREERSHGHAVPVAVRRSVQTAGRTVVLSAATVALSLLSLLVFPVAYLRSFAVAGVAVVATAGIAAVAVVPALLARYGHRLGQERPRAGGGWALQARRVMRHPWLWILACAGLLIAAGLPFRAFEPGRVDDRVLPVESDARRGAEQLRKDFYFVDFNPISVVAPYIQPRDDAALTDLETSILTLANVFRIDSLHGFVAGGANVPPNAYSERFRGEEGAGTWLNVTSWRDPDHPAAEALVRKIRALDPRLQVTGTTATVIDTVDSVVRQVPLALGIIAVTTLVLLFVMTGSLLVPLKAVLLNLLSLTATFGALVWVFQQGHLGGLAGVTATGRLDVFTPILMFCVAFGLSMDYEVFLLARIKESHDLGRSNIDSVAEGLGHTGRLVTAAALLLAVVFLAIATSSVTIVRMFGVGLALAVLVDAFVIRATLVPALMRLAGRANWWAPGPLRRFHLRFGVWEHDPIELPSAVDGEAYPAAESEPAAVGGSASAARRRPFDDVSIVSSRRPRP